MSRRPAFPFRPKDSATEEFLEHLRKGTREQFESSWEVINPGADKSYSHGLGEIPWMVDVVQAEDAGGKSATIAADATATKTSDTITVTVAATATAGLFYKVRAL